MAIANHDVAVRQFLKAGGPFQIDVRTRNAILDLPDNFFVGRYFDNTIATPGCDQRVSVSESNGAIDPRTDRVVPNNFTSTVVFGDDPWLFRANKVSLLRRDPHQPSGLHSSLFQRNLMDNLPVGIDLDDPPHATLGNHSATVRQPGERVNVNLLPGVPVHRR